MIEKGSWSLYLYKQHAYIPTTARTTAGFYLAVEPIEVIDLRDRSSIEHAMLRAVKRGNPRVPTPSRANFPRNPLLEYTKLKSNASFDRFTTSWQLSISDGAYIIIPDRLREDTGKEEDTERGEAIPADVPLEEVVHRLVRRALEEAGHRG